jgi:hypothetical protein
MGVQTYPRWMYPAHSVADCRECRRDSCAGNCNTIQEPPPLKRNRSAYRNEYKACWHMLARCYDPGNVRYLDYGGRGVTVCDRWRESFEHFLVDVGPRPGRGWSLDRIRNDQGYAPSNCRWSSAIEQVRNRRPRAEVARDRAWASDPWAGEDTRA